MDEDTFWKLIGQLDWDKTGDDDAVAEPAVRLIASMAVEDISSLRTYSPRVTCTRHQKALQSLLCWRARSDNGDDYISADDFLPSLRCCGKWSRFFDSALQTRGRCRRTWNSKHSPESGAKSL